MEKARLAKQATLAGGCFWCSEAIFKRLKGVGKVTSGYSGGEIENPSYWDVASSMTDHAEAIQIEFDPKIISFEKLLEIFFALHDPTTLNRQGADVGTEYRSAIFYHDEVQKEAALKAKEKAKKLYEDKIVTEISPFKNFYRAEDSHQNFYENNQGSMYCSLVIDPKIQKLLDKFNSEVKEQYKSS